MILLVTMDQYVDALLVFTVVPCPIISRRGQISNSWQCDRQVRYETLLLNSVLPSNASLLPFYNNNIIYGRLLKLKLRQFLRQRDAPRTHLINLELADHNAATTTCEFQRGEKLTGAAIANVEGQQTGIILLMSRHLPLQADLPWHHRQCRCIIHI